MAAAVAFTDIYSSEALATGIEDAPHSTTHFSAIAQKLTEAGYKSGDEDTVTSFVFVVRNVPAALCKARGGFATNSVNTVKLENYPMKVIGVYSAHLYR